MEQVKRGERMRRAETVTKLIDQFEKIAKSEVRERSNAISRTASQSKNLESLLMNIELPNEGEEPDVREQLQSANRTASIMINIHEGKAKEESKINDKRQEFQQLTKTSSKLSSYVCLDSQEFMEQISYEENLLITPNGASPHIKEEFRSSSNVDEQKRGRVDEPQMKSANVNSSSSQSTLNDTQNVFKNNRRANFAHKYTMKSIAEVSSSKLKLITENNLKEEKLNKYERLRKEVVKEIVQTERDYVRDLQILISVFLIPIRKQELLSSYDIVSLFSNIEALLPLNQALLEDLEQALNISNNSNDTAALYSQWVGEIFIDHIPKMDRKYQIYCSNHPNIHSRLETYQTNSAEFKKFLHQCYKEDVCRKLSIDAFLIMPLQRICKYPLFFKQLIHYTPENLSDGEYTTLMKGFKVVEEMVNEVNKKVKQVQNLVSMVELLLKIENGSEYFSQIVDETHELLQEGIFVINGERSHVTLFSNLLLFCSIHESSLDKESPRSPPSSSSSSSSEGTYQPVSVYADLNKEFEKIKVYLCAPLRQCTCVTTPNDKTDFTIVYEGVSYVLSAHNKSAKVSWCSKIKRCINEQSNLPDVERTPVRKSATIVISPITPLHSSPRFSSDTNNSLRLSPKGNHPSPPFTGKHSPHTSSTLSNNITSNNSGGSGNSNNNGNNSSSSSSNGNSGNSGGSNSNSGSTPLRNTLERKKKRHTGNFTSSVKPLTEKKHSQSNSPTLKKKSDASDSHVTSPPSKNRKKKCKDSDCPNALEVLELKKKLLAANIMICDLREENEKLRLKLGEDI